MGSTIRKCCIDTVDEPDSWSVVRATTTGVVAANTTVRTARRVLISHAAQGQLRGRHLGIGRFPRWLSVHLSRELPAAHEPCGRARQFAEPGADL